MSDENGWRVSTGGDGHVSVLSAKDAVALGQFIAGLTQRIELLEKELKCLRELNNELTTENEWHRKRTTKHDDDIRRGLRSK